MFTLSRRVATLRALILGVLMAAIFSVAGFILSETTNDGVKAINTKEGETVTISYSDDDVAFYGDYDSDGLRWMTHYFYVNGSLGWCANAEKNSTRGQFIANTYDGDSYGEYKKSDLIKLMAYIYQYEGVNSAAGHAIFDGWVNPSHSGNGYNEYYAYAHATIGYIYDGVLLHGLPNNTNVLKAINTLGSFISNNSEVWQKAKGYKTARIRSGNSMQDVVWIEAPTRGDLRFVKEDTTNNEVMADTIFRITSLETEESHIVVTDAYGVVDTSTSYAPHSYVTNGYDAIYENTGTATNSGYGIWFIKEADGTASEVNDYYGALPYGQYLIEELECRANRFCSLTDQTKVVTINSNLTLDLGTWENTCAQFDLGTTATDNADGDDFLEEGIVTIKDVVSYCVKPNTDFVIKGILMDKSTGAPLVVNGKTIEGSANINSAEGCGEVEILFTFDATGLAGKDLVVFESLYYENEIIKEHADINDEGQTVTVVSLGTTATDSEDGDKFIEAGQTAISDIVEYCVKPNTNFTIKGILMDKETGEPLLIDGKTVEGSVVVNSESGCGTAEIIFNLDASELGGKDIVVFETLYFENEFVTEHADINDEGQTVTVVSLGTTATDNEDGDHYIEEGEEVTIKDTVEYCVKPNTEFTIKGILMDKTTGEPFLVNGETVEASTTINSEEGCGSVDLFFTFDASGFGGQEIVVFESLYFEDEFVTEHADLDDEDQTVIVVKLHTLATDAATEEKELPYGKDVVIKDVVTYCIIPDREYTLVGVLMNKATHGPVMVDGNPLVQTITFIPEETCGEVEMFFELNTTGLPGAELVIFENLYYGDELILAHADFEDVDETVKVDDPIPAPNTGIFSKDGIGLRYENGIIFWTALIVAFDLSRFFIKKYGKIEQ